jgi:Leucine-rich repeat (LRR) protein
MTISNNHIGGTIPDVEDLKVIGGDVLSQIRLKKVDISYNDVTGTLPLLTALIPSLVYLDISGNAISGPFPFGGVGSWPSIEHLAAKDCNFGGPLPFHFSGLLTSLDLSGNNLTGVIPSEFSLYKDLKSLSLSHNPLFSSLPTEIIAMTQLEVLRIRNCSLHGMLPLGLSLFSAKEIDFGANRLNGAMDEKLGYLDSLEILNLEYNNFTDSIPSELGRLTLLSTLNLANNMLTGTLPSELGNLSYLESFSVANNSLNGSIPGSFCAIMSDLSMNEIGCAMICECCSGKNICE